jgi:deoxyribonuclease IV
VVMHPGAFVESNEEAGLERIVLAIRQIYERVAPKKSWLLLENTAGQGTVLGWQMEQLQWMLERTGASMQVGICLDTCHAHAAGYDLSTAAGFKAWEKKAIGCGVLDAIRALHLNDSKKDCGSRVDRHEHIGLGTIGLDGFKRVLKHKRLRELPMYLETEKEDETRDDWDAVNMAVLRGCE